VKIYPSNWKRVLVKTDRQGMYMLLVRSCLMHGSETWPTKVEHEMKLNRTEISMIRWMCGVKLNVRRKLKKDWNQSV